MIIYRDVRQVNNVKKHSFRTLILKGIYNPMEIFRFLKSDMDIDLLDNENCVMPPHPKN